eukprot:CAMPEP_0119051804 /NCGR_PEP_ID=MMETSP1177-20130426/73298_1 /TAXON_ID=2985 /ORGANISM="Ochromonas sp, Strain CCMP1899" /LENGTH=354 /DNA_ID=CAMNT_0007031129 /DNA_START=113 /DNA_END=1178 /DNA_ORIENTATION=-
MLSRTLVVFLHGSGGTGPDLRSFLDLVPLEQFGHKTFRKVAEEKNIEYICPTAVMRPYTAAMGQKTNVWFDRSGDFTQKGLDDYEDLETTNSSVTQILSLIDSMEDSYVDIFVGGFSQGGCLSLHLMRSDIAMRLSHKVRGIFSMGSFLVKSSVVLKNSVDNRLANLPLIMMHGEEDSLILYEWGHSTATSLLLENRDLDIQFKGYPDLDHDIGDEELVDLLLWIDDVRDKNATDRSVDIEGEDQINDIDVGLEDEVAAITAASAPGSNNLSYQANGEGGSDQPQHPSVPYLLTPLPPLTSIPTSTVTLVTFHIPIEMIHAAISSPILACGGTFVLSDAKSGLRKGKVAQEKVL